MISNIKIILLSLLLLSLFFPDLVRGSEKIGDNSELGLLLYFHTDQDAKIKDYYNAGGKVKLETKPSKAWKFNFELRAANDAVRLEELWGRYRFAVPEIKFGIFENSHLMEDEFNHREMLFADEGYVRSRLHQMGWYSDNSAGIRVSVDSDKTRLGIEYGGELFYISNSSEIMLNGRLSYPWAGEDSFLGASVSYYPHFIHDLWGDSRSASISSPHLDGFYKKQYMLYSLFFGDESEEKRLIYKLEASMGNNLNDPVGYIQYPGDGGTSWFLGTDYWMGYIVPFEKLEWTPGINGSFYIHDLSDAKANTGVVRIGNRFSWDRTFFIHLDAGVEIDSFYRQEGGDKKLKTDLEVLCAVRLQYKY